MDPDPAPEDLCAAWRAFWRDLLAHDAAQQRAARGAPPAERARLDREWARLQARAQALDAWTRARGRAGARGATTLARPGPRGGHQTPEVGGVLVGLAVPQEGLGIRDSSETSTDAASVPASRVTFAKWLRAQGPPIRRSCPTCPILQMMT